MAEISMAKTSIVVVVAAVMAETVSVAVVTAV